jgi:hypothetical protein
MITASEPGGVLHLACGNRRETVCPACSQVYKRDARHLVRAGPIGETLAGRYNLASHDLGRVRDQRREILAHVARRPFRRFFRSRLILKDRG